MSSLINRHNFILEELSKSGKISVDELANHFHVSLVTIRKDLSMLEERGLLKRVQGYATLSDETDLNKRLAANHTLKREIVKNAAALVSDGETLMIESGSCCILLADELCKTKKNLTIITNSTFLAAYTGKNTNVKIILLGGDYQPDSQAVVGPITKMCASIFHVDKFFAGTDGYIPGKGFTGDNHLRVEALKDMSHSANQIIIVTESKKFAYLGVVPLFNYPDVKHVFTDSGISPQLEDELRRNNVTITLTHSVQS